MRLNTIIIIALIIIILYLLQVPAVRIYADIAMDKWNLTVEYVLYFKDKEPYVFMCLPLVLVYLLGKK